MFSVEVPRGPDGQLVVPQQVVALAAEVRELKARLGQNSSNSSRPPSSDAPFGPRRRVAPPEPSSGRRAGGQPGHPGHFRAVVPPERVDVVVDHWPECCVGCATLLVARGAAEETEDYVAHQVTELPPLRAVVTEHRLHRVACPRCGATTRATLPADVPAGAFGPRLQATVATLRGRFRLSCREVAELGETVLEAPLSVGSVETLCQATSDALAAPVAAAVATLPQAPVVK